MARCGECERTGLDEDDTAEGLCIDCSKRWATCPCGAEDFRREFDEQGLCTSCHARAEAA